MVTALFTTTAGAEIPPSIPEVTKSLPGMHVDAVSPTPVKGVYEVLAGSNVFYFAEGGYVFFGELWDNKGHSLTAGALNIAMKKKLETLPLEKALKIGTGPKKVIEFTDPDCPYCREVDKYLSQRTDITRYIFFFPLPFHKNAPAKASHILCSENKTGAHRDVFTGLLDSAVPVDCEAGRATLAEHAAQAKKMGVRGTPSLWIEGEFVSGADTKRIKAILDGPNTK